jgi:hypothetical protein
MTALHIDCPTVAVKGAYHYKVSHTSSGYNRPMVDLQFTKPETNSGDYL